MPSDVRRVSQTLFDESTPGGRFEISLEGNRHLSVSESDCCLEFPRHVFGCVRHLATIMFCQTRFKIFGEAGIKMVRRRQGVENVNVAVGIHGLPSRSPLPRAWVSPPSLFELRRGSLRPPPSGGRRLVEAAGVEPASLANPPAATTC